MSEKPIKISVQTAEEALYARTTDFNELAIKEKLLKEMGRKIFLSNELIRKSKLVKPTNTSSRLKMYLFGKIKPIENFSIFFKTSDGTEVMLSQKEIYEKVPEEARTYRISVADYCKENGLTKGGKNYNTVKKDIEYLHGDCIWIPLLDDPDPKKRQLVSWVEKVIDNGDNTFDLTIHKDLIPYLYIDTKRGNFVETEYFNGQKFKCSHSSELYLLLKSFATYEKMPIVISIDNLRERIGVGIDQYSDTNNFLRRCVEPCVCEINQYSDIYIRSYNTVKKGNKITAVAFDIIEKNDMFVEAYKSRLVDDIYNTTYAKKTNSNKKNTVKEVEETPL